MNVRDYQRRHDIRVRKEEEAIRVKLEMEAAIQRQREWEEYHERARQEEAKRLKEQYLKWEKDRRYGDSDDDINYRISIEQAKHMMQILNYGSKDVYDTQRMMEAMKTVMGEW